MFKRFSTFVTYDNTPSVRVLLVLNARRVVSKSLATVRAHVWPLASVNPEMYLDPISRLKNFITVRAGESYVTVHCVYVVPQVALTRKLFGAILANHTVFFFTFAFILRVTLSLCIIRFLHGLIFFIFHGEIHSAIDTNIIKKSLQ